MRALALTASKELSAPQPMRTNRLCRYILSCTLLIGLRYDVFGQGNDEGIPDISGKWVFCLEVEVAGGECGGDLGDVGFEESTILHDAGSTSATVIGILDNPNERHEGTVTYDAINEEYVFAYSGTFSEEEGWTERSVRMSISPDGNSMVGKEDWEWGISQDDNAPDECPNSRSAWVGYRTARISDDFEDGERDSTYWSADQTREGGSFTEHFGRLEFRSTGQSSDDYAERPWIAHELPWWMDWQIEATLYNVAEPQGIGATAASILGLWVRKNGNASEQVGVEYRKTPVSEGFYASLLNPNIELASVDTSLVDTEAWTVRMDYRADTGIVEIVYRVRDSNEDEWQYLARFGIAGFGADDGNANWGMEKGDVLHVGVWGLGRNHAVKFGQAYFSDISVLGGGAQVALTEKPGFTPTEAKDDRLSIRRNFTGYRINVLANDSVRPPGLRSDLAITELSVPSQGGSVSTEGGFVTYNPPFNYIGFETFEYTIDDGQGGVDSATVTIESLVDPPETPDANEDEVTVDTNASQYRIDVMDNDTVDPPLTKENLEVVGVGTDEGGSVFIEAATEWGGRVTTNGSEIFYTPPEGFTGMDVFTYDLSDGLGDVDWTTVKVNVVEPGRAASDMGSYGSQLARLMWLSPEGRRILDLWHKHRAEVFYILLTNPSIGGQALSVTNGFTATVSSEESAKQSKSAVRRLASFEIGEDGVAREAYASIQSGLANFMTGSGDQLLLSQETVDQAVALTNAIRENASDGLKRSIDEELSDLPEMVNKSYNEFLASFGVEATNLSIVAYSPIRDKKSFSISAPNLDGVDYALWKTSSLENPSWIRVDNVVIEKTDLDVTIADPNPGDEPAFYRLQSEVGQIGDAGQSPF